MEINQIEDSMQTIQTSNAAAYSILSNNQHYAVPLVALLVAYFIILPKSWHILIITYFLGLLNGLTLAALIIFFLVKLEMIDFAVIKLKEILNSGAIKIPDKVCQNNEENFVNEQIHSLLIQSAIQKENKIFDGVYKVSFFLVFKIFLNLEWQ